MSENAESRASRSVLEQIPETVRARRWFWRRIKDRLARHGVAVGGVGVVIAITLIFFYLLYVVFPMLLPASAEPRADYPVAHADGAAAFLVMEEQAEIAGRLTREGAVRFFRVGDGSVLATFRLPLAEGERVVGMGRSAPLGGTFAFGTDHGRVLVVKPVYDVSYPGDRRVIRPRLEYPLGETPVALDPEGRAIVAVAVESGEETTLAGVTEDGRILLARYALEESLLEDEGELVETRAELPPFPEGPVRFLRIDARQQNLYLVDAQGNLMRYEILDAEAPVLAEKATLHAARHGRLRVLEMLTGGISLLAGYEDGVVEQWFGVRGEDGRSRLTFIRAFDGLSAPITWIAPERARKGFLALDADGNAALYHTTSERLLLRARIADAPLVRGVLAPRGDMWLIEDATGRLHAWAVHNPHPEISWKALWGKVWYESYPEPDWVWQSSSSDDDFEPKFSLTPLAFGTLKAAFYAMIFAVPLALLGAIYTAYFMSPRMRGLVKPAVEVMEALPTVILGFLAGLWLAPFIELYLPGVFLMLVLLPLGVLAFALAWSRLPVRVRGLVPEGWEALALIPVIGLILLAAFLLSQPLELAFFDGDIRQWMHDRFGIGYDQRNSIVVGLAMGFAVIPTIFSIAEDAIFNVPRHLTTGSLALGATPWQTLTRVVLLTASPGIFSAVMIGLGRAVGETMIVLMATGNTPVMDFSIFQGMRTLSANIAVEMPESEVASTHYRILFLAGLVLFLATFLFNTLAELVRQRLRRRYSSL